MTAHDHASIVPGCFRCEIGADETNPAFDWPRPLHSADEWCALLGVTVLDPDGWDRSGQQAFEASWAEPITEAEFRARVATSTVAHLEMP